VRNPFQCAFLGAACWLASGPAAFGCSCDGHDFFIDWKGTPIVVGVVERNRSTDDRFPPSVDLRVTDVLNGVEPRPVVRLWAFGTAACSASIGNYRPGTILVVALERNGAGFDWKGTVLVQYCGANFVKIRSSPDDSGFELSDVKRRLADAKWKKTSGTVAGHPTSE